MKKEIAFIAAAVILFATIACGKEEKASQAAPETTAEESIQETEVAEAEPETKVAEAEPETEAWTIRDMTEFLCSAKYWYIDSENMFIKFEENGNYSEGYLEKGEPEHATWEVIEPNVFHVQYLGNSFKETVTELNANSFKFGEYSAVAREQAALSETLSKHIPLFSSGAFSDEKTEASGSEFVKMDYCIPYVVATDDGSPLNIRDYPVTGNKTGTFSDGSEIMVTQRTKEKYTVDGITDYWYYGFCLADIEPWGGWVFGGYIKNKER